MLRVCSLSLLKQMYMRSNLRTKNSLKHHSLWTASPKTPSCLLFNKYSRPYSIAKDERPLRPYPIGESDYKGIKTQRLFAFDKTLFLKHFFDDSARVSLLLRPRRFGKTTTMSMLKYFSDMNEPQSSREMMFKDTKIWREQGGQYVRDHCGQYPVIFISFNEYSSTNWRDMKTDLEALISDVYNHHRYLMEKDFLAEYKKLEFTRVLESWYITGRKIVGENRAMVRVPNEEILRDLMSMYARILQRLMSMTPDRCVASLVQGDVTEFEKGLKQAAINTFSFYNDNKSNQEVAHHMWVLGFVEPLRSLGYTIKSNREDGVRRYDIFITPNVPNDEQYSVILAFKAPTIDTKEEKEIMKTLDKSAEEALQQIIRKYYDEANGKKKLLALGIALQKKYLSIKLA